MPASLRFGASDTEKSFTFNATQDSFYDDGESVELGFGSLPEGIVAGANAPATVGITGDDVNPDYVGGDTGTDTAIGVGQSWMDGNGVRGSVESYSDLD